MQKYNGRDKPYLVHDIFGPTIQGEGPLAGTPCIFLRFSLCNMWNGIAKYREISICPFCDTEFNNRRPMEDHEIIQAILEERGNHKIQWIWISGGEPALQLDIPLLNLIKSHGFRIGLETNGTLDIPYDALIDHLTMSPKRPWDHIKVRRADTLKILYPHPNAFISPEAFSTYDARNKYLQPIDPGNAEGLRENTEKTISKLYDLGGNWKLSVQTHKMIGVE